MKKLNKETGRVKKFYSFLWKSTKICNIKIMRRQEALFINMTINEKIQHINIADSRCFTHWYESQWKNWIWKSAEPSSFTYRYAGQRIYII